MLNRGQDSGHEKGYKCFVVRVAAKGNGLEKVESVCVKPSLPSLSAQSFFCLAPCVVLLLLCISLFFLFLIHQYNNILYFLNFSEDLAEKQETTNRQLLLF